MADVVRLVPRLWDGQRLLRFLTGLAMLALAFAAHAGLTGPAAITPAASAPAAPAASASAVGAPAASAETRSAEPVTRGDGSSVAIFGVLLALLVAGGGLARGGALGAVPALVAGGVSSRGPPRR